MAQTYAEMVLEAVIKLKSRSGSSQPAILKYVKSHFDVNGRSVKDSGGRVITGEFVHLSTGARTSTLTSGPSSPSRCSR